MRSLALAGLAAAALAGCVVVPVDPGPPYAPAVVVRPGPVVVRPHYRHHHHYRDYDDRWRYRYRYRD